MSDQPTTPARDEGGTPVGPVRPTGGPVGGPAGATAPAAPRRSSLSWLLPAATFLIGLVLGVVIMGVSGGPDTLTANQVPDVSESAVAPTPIPSTRPDATVTVPGACLDLADSSEQLVGLATDAAESIRDLDASALSAIVRELQASQAGLTEQSDACRSAAGAAVVSPSTDGTDG